jgi:hypothetical protein
MTKMVILLMLLCPIDYPDMDKAGEKDITAQCLRSRILKQE